MEELFDIILSESKDCPTMKKNQRKDAKILNFFCTANLLFLK